MTEIKKNAWKPKASARERRSWYFYDFGNSAYAAVVLLAVYSAYFKGSVVGGAEGTRLWGIAVGIAMLLVAVTAPVLGAIADFAGTKKKVLLFYTAMACFFTAMLFFVQKGDIVMGMIFFILAEFAYRSAQVFYNSLLPDIAHLDEMGHISGNGWAIGSLGGIVCLVIVLAAIMLIGGAFVTRLSFVFTALFFAASAAPLFLFLKERTEPQKLPKGENYISLAFKRIGETFRMVKDHKQFIRFIIAYLIYNDGIMMTMNFAAIIGAVLFGMQQQELIIFMIVVQVFSVAGAWVFGKMAGKTGGKRALLVSLTLMILTVLVLMVVQSVPMFYAVGAMAGFALTGVQSVSRTMVGQLAPPGKAAEFYGFYSMAGRTSSFIGPTVYGWLTAFLAFRLQNRGVDRLLAEQIGTRNAVLSIAAFLLVGTVILLFAVNDPTRIGHKQAEEGSAVE